MAEKFFLSLVGGCIPVGSQGLVKAKLLYVLQWKENPERVLQVMTRASEEWALIETELQDRA